MKKKKRKRRMINAKMAEIIRTLHQKGGAMSAHEIAETTGFSYITVRKYLKELENLAIIWELMSSGKGAVIVTMKKRPKKRGPIRRYSLNYSLIFEEDDEKIRKAYRSKPTLKKPKGKELNLVRR